MSPEEWSELIKVACFSYAEAMRHVVAAGEGNAESLEIIMAHGCNLDRQDQGGYTPLMTATQHGHNAVARMLIDAGANRDMASVPGGKTALMIAAERGNVALCRALLEPTVVVGMRRVYHAVWGSTIMTRMRQLRALYVQLVMCALEVPHPKCLVQLERSIMMEVQ